MDLYQMLQTASLLIAFGAVYGKLTEKTKRIEGIETQLNNHITHIAADIKEIYRETTRMRERLSAIEERTKR